MIAVAILMGVLPNIFLKPMGPSIERMLNQLQQGSAPARIEAQAPSREPRVSGVRVASPEPRAPR
jgi:hypothetical protein